MSNTDVRVWGGVGHFSEAKKKVKETILGEKRKKKSCYTGKPTQKSINKFIQAHTFARAMVFALRPYCPASTAKNLARTHVSVKVPNFQFGSQKPAINQAFN